VAIKDIGWNPARRGFVDLAENPLLHAFKLYPWEWMFLESFGPHLLESTTRWLEAPWKVLLSNKAILAVLWEMFPGNQYLLPASLQALEGDVVVKPRQAREGANIQILRAGRPIFKTEGTYCGPFVWQRYAPIRTFDGKTPVIGSWMVNGNSCGIGIREDDGLITGNFSRFVPHFFTP
jgi:glutathionylspermidine synthase